MSLEKADSSTLSVGAKTIRSPVKPRVTILGLLATNGLLLLTILLAIVFSILLPTTFPTVFTVQSILVTKSISALLAFAVMIPLVTNQFDLSVGYTIGLTHILAIGLQVRSGIPWELTVLIVLLVGGMIGLINGILVDVAGIDSFIATLGSGTIAYSLANWYTNGQQVFGKLPHGFILINGATVLGIPMPAIYVLILSFILWITLEFLPVGRYMYVIGSNPRAADLAGIPRRRYIIGAFTASGLITALAGITLASQLQVGQSNIGPDYLLPAFVGALLGSTTIKPGRVNVWGTIIAVLILAIGISGIQQFGGAFFVEPLFNGTTLVVAVGVAAYAARRRLRADRAREAHQS